MTEHESTPPQKKARYLCKFSVKVSHEYPYFQASILGDTFAFCTICKMDISIGNSGKGDIKKHIGTPKHLAHECAASQAAISAPQPSAISCGDSEDVRAETLCANCFPHNNTSPYISTAGDIIKKEQFDEEGRFSDSESAASLKNAHGQIITIFTFMNPS